MPSAARVKFLTALSATTAASRSCATEMIFTRSTQRVSRQTPFDFYGVPPLLGRGITPADGLAKAPPVFVMGYKTWKGEFHSDPGILGKSFLVDGNAANAYRDHASAIPGLRRVSANLDADPK